MGRGKTQSRHQRSRSCECRGSWGNTALSGRTGPDTPVDTDKDGGLDEIIYTRNTNLEQTDLERTGEPETKSKRTGTFQRMDKMY